MASKPESFNVNLARAFVDFQKLIGGSKEQRRAGVHFFSALDTPIGSSKFAENWKTVAIDLLNPDLALNKELFSNLQADLTNILRSDDLSLLVKAVVEVANESTRNDLLGAKREKVEAKEFTIMQLNDSPNSSPDSISPIPSPSGAQSASRSTSISADFLRQASDPLTISHPVNQEAARTIQISENPDSDSQDSLTVSDVSEAEIEIEQQQLPDIKEAEMRVQQEVVKPKTPPLSATPQQQSEENEQTLRIVEPHISASAASFLISSMARTAATAKTAGPKAPKVLQPKGPDGGPPPQAPKAPKA